MIKVENLVKKFGEINAVDDISFSIDSGQVVGLLGPNGAGKTTTMRLITGFLAPTSGTVTINGINVVSDPVKVKQQIGYLPENNPLFTEMLVSEYLEFSCRIKKITKADQKTAVSKVVLETGIKEVYFRPINELSKGYRQRVGLAQALIGDPSILIFDEPTEGLDPNQRVEIRELIRDLGHDKTVILSTHVMQEVTAVCGRIIIINKGKIVADGKSEEIQKQKTGLRRMRLTLSGNNLEETLKSISSIKSFLGTTTDNQKATFELEIDPVGHFEEDLSRIIARNSFVLWELVPEERGLEEIFRELTG